MKFIIALTMIMSLFGCGKEDANRKPEGAFKEYEYKESNMREYPAEYYLLEVSKDNGLTLTWAKHNSDFTVLRVPEDAAEKLTALINEHKLHKLKNSYRPPFDVRDGTMWHVYIRYEKSRISCSADNAWPPKDLWNGILAINAYLDSLIEASRESDIIEVRKNR